MSNFWTAEKTLEYERGKSAARYLVLTEAVEAALEHVAELREAWERGCITEHDTEHDCLGGTRSNRNVAVEIQLRRALK